MPVISQKVLSDLTNFLIDHEEDIAKGVGDYGKLARVYEKVLGRKAEAE